MACKRWAKYPNQNVKIASWVVEKSARKREREKQRKRSTISHLFEKQRSNFGCCWVCNFTGVPTTALNSLSLFLLLQTLDWIADQVNVSDHL